MSDPAAWHSRGYLPHYDDRSAIQLITYRLADALPESVVAKLNERRLDHAAFRKETEYLLDAGYGACLLREELCASAVVEGWRHFENRRYRLHAWVVMPNHVHVLVKPLGNEALSAIVHSWKSYTAKVIFRGCPSTSFSDRQVWQPDYWDRFIRDERHYRTAVDYIHNNPVKAGLVAESHDWRWSSAAAPGSAGVPPAVD